MIDAQTNKALKNFRQCLFCCQNADGNGLAGAIVP